MRADLLRTTSFRTALLLSAIFIVALGVSALAAGYVIREDLAKRLDASITDTYNVIGQSLGDSDVADLVAAVRSFSRATVSHDRVFQLLDPGGRILAGNLTVAPRRNGWTTTSAASLGLDGHAAYRLFSGIVGNYRLVIGSSYAESAAVNDIVLSSSMWAAALFAAIVVAAGVAIAIRAQRRLDAIAGTMQRVGRGELAARIPLSRGNDDVDALSRQVNAALDRLAALVEGMRQVSVDIAHDLKTPLNRLAITVESANEAGRRGKPVANLLAQASAESRQINATFEALLRIAQIEAGARRARFVPVAIPPILETVMEVYADTAIERGQHLTLETDDELPPILGDKELLIQLFANLMENALRHGVPGVSVRLAGRREGGSCIISVDDNGPGIPQVEWERVFRRLYRLDKSRSTPGNGLGLSIVKAIADLHGATIELVDNTPGLGVRVIF
jgi:signal transduction histidine kinase